MLPNPPHPTDQHISDTLEQYFNVLQQGRIETGHRRAKEEEHGNLDDGIRNCFELVPDILVKSKSYLKSFRDSEHCFR